jgi:perosamine synthetase
VPKINIPYGRQSIDSSDKQAVIDVLKSDWLTTGPKILEFENDFSNFVGSEHSVAVSSGTAALHCCIAAINIGAGDEVIVPSMTFVATANAIVFQGGTPVFADVDKDTLLIDTCDVARKITPKTKAIIAVDYAGQPADYDRLKSLASHHNLYLIADACHSIGGSYKGASVGTLADLSAFSFHPVKHITTGEGGMITTENGDLAQRIRNFRNHGITTDHRQREELGSWYYEMVELGFNYRLSDLQCALGISQLKKLTKWINIRQNISSHYDDSFHNTSEIKPLKINNNLSHAYHLYVIKINFEALNITKEKLFYLLREHGIGVNVHYLPVHYHPFYKKNYNTKPGMCPVAEKVYEQILSLPIYPNLSEIEQVFVIDKIKKYCV